MKMSQADQMDCLVVDFKSFTQSYAGVKLT